MPGLLLASQSPRRRQLLEQIGFTFEVMAADIDETPRPQEPPEIYVQRVAREKAQWFRARGQFDDHVIVAADTSVILDDAILGKPKDPDEGAGPPRFTVWTHPPSVDRRLRCPASTCHHVGGLVTE